MGENGTAVGIDHIDELVTESIKNVKKDPKTSRLLETGQIKLVVGDGRKGQSTKTDLVYLPSFPYPRKKLTFVY